MDLCAVGCCTIGLISVLYVPLTVKYGRKCSLLRLHGLYPSTECTKKLFFFLFSIFLELTKLNLSRARSLCYPGCTQI